MAIDNIAQIGLATTRPATQKTPAAAADGRQDLPGSGESRPEAASEVKQAVSRLNDYVQSLRRDLQFQIDEESNRVVVTVIDSETQEVIRQIPSEEVLALARVLGHREDGLILNTQV